jgi:hypothetical protein
MEPLIMNALIHPLLAKVFGSPLALTVENGDPTPLPPPALVFGASRLRTYASGSSTVNYAPPAAQLNEIADIWHAFIPAGSYIVYSNCPLTSDGIPVGAGRELMPGNSNTLDYCVLFTGPSGTGTRIPVPFNGNQSAVMPDGGFAIAGPTPEDFPGGYIRTSITTPSGGKRPGGWNANTSLGEVRGIRGSAGLPAGYNGGSVASGTPTTSRGFQPIAVLVPGTSLAASLALFGDSITQQDDAIQLASLRGMLGGIVRGLDDDGGVGRMGVGNFGHHGASMIDFMDVALGNLKFGQRYALLKYIKDNLNGGRWPMTAIWSQGLRNDFSGISSPTTAEEALPLLKERAQSWWDFLNLTFPGVPIIQSTVTARVSADTTTGYTTVEAQEPRQYTAGPALEWFNDWLMTKPAPIYETVDFRPMQQEMKQTSYGISPVWKRTEFTVAGGGTLVSALTAGVAITTLTVAAPVAPRKGTYGVLEPGTENFELRGTISNVAENGDGTYVITFLTSTTPTKNHAAGAVFKTAHTPDGTHLGHDMHTKTTGPVIAAKARITALVAQEL